MKNYKYILLVFSFLFMGACQDLDIPPTNILTDEDIYNEAGIKAYMVGLYNHLPMDDFNVSQEGDKGGYYNWNNIVWPMLSTGETGNRNNTGIYIPEKGYWSQGYQIIRQANTLIQNLPAYIGQLDGAESWIAEARFIRAYVYFQLTKRYGGIPLIEKPQPLPQGENSESSLWVARNSHEESYDFILADLDYAIENMTAKSAAGRANKYVAAALKSRVANFAGSIARYGQKYNYSVEGVMLCGIPEARANNYFQQAWDASVIVEKGGYKLLQAEGGPTEDNFANIWQKADDSPESIFIRQYDYINYRHSFDAVYCPPRMTTTYGDRYNVTLDWVELFDGLPINPATGKIRTTDDDNNYIVFNTSRELFQNAEPRLRASILLPGNTYKGIELDIRRGIIKETVDPSEKIQKMSIDDGQNTQSYSTTGGSFWKDNILETTENITQQKPYELANGVKLNKNGMDGPANGGSNNTITGFHGRKWLSMDLTVGATKLHESHQTWIDIRYAEVLLNRAEAAIELSQNGVATYGGKNMIDDAYESINKIRTRAGADLLSSSGELSTAPAYEKGAGKGGFVQAPNRALQILRVERYKELAFEHKIYWDLRRWFTFDTQIYNYRRRMLNPFLFAKGATVNENGNPEGKYIYDARVSERANNNLTFATKYYYEKIPDGQIKTNPLLKQNNQY